MAEIITKLQLEVSPELFELLNQVIDALTTSQASLAEVQQQLVEAQSYSNLLEDRIATLECQINLAGGRRGFYL